MGMQDCSDTLWRDAEVAIVLRPRACGIRISTDEKRSVVGGSARAITGAQVPDTPAQTYLDVLRQPRSAWTWEVELRPWVETF